jgi:hypothetical protein
MNGHDESCQMTVHTRNIVWMRKQSRAPEINPSEHNHTTSVQSGASGASWAQPGTTSVTKHDPCNRSTCIWGSNHVCDVGGVRGTTHFSKNDRVQGDATNTHNKAHNTYTKQTASTRMHTQALVVNPIYQKVPSHHDPLRYKTWHAGHGKRRKTHTKHRRADGPHTSGRPCWRTRGAHRVSCEGNAICQRRGRALWRSHGVFRRPPCLSQLQIQKSWEKKLM